MVSQSTISGPTHVDGHLKAMESNFQEIIVNGPFKAMKVEFGTLNINGPCNLTETTAKGNITLNGTMEAIDSHLMDITAATTKLKLMNTNAGNILIKENGISGKTQYVYLQGNTTVGNIVFESGNGIVQADQNASFGKVIGGSVQKYTETH